MKKSVWYPTPAFSLRRYLFGRVLPRSCRGRFLEVGIGEGGGFLSLLSDRGLVGTGIDYSYQVVLKARSLLKGKLKRGISIKKRSLWQWHRKVDLIVAMEVFEHCHQDKKMLSHCFKLLKRDGWLGKS